MAPYSLIARVCSGLGSEKSGALTCVPPRAVLRAGRRGPGSEPWVSHGPVVSRSRLVSPFECTFTFCIHDVGGQDDGADELRGSLQR